TKKDAHGTATCVPEGNGFRLPAHLQTSPTADTAFAAAATERLLLDSEPDTAAQCPPLAGTEEVISQNAHTGEPKGNVTLPEAHVAGKTEAFTRYEIRVFECHGDGD